MSGALDTLARRIQDAKRLTILTGAGVSAASGVPTFRGPAGLWRRHRAEDLATPEAFANNPRLVWEWYAWRREMILSCQPNPAHDVIAEWSLRPGCQVLTQNVDDLHVRAGTRSLARIHGSIWELSCWQQCERGATPWRDESVPFATLPPRCPHCGGLARPAVIWFGESLRSDDLRAAFRATACDLFIAVGTSAVVYPAAGLCDEARAAGAVLIVVNAEPTPYDSVADAVLRQPIGAVLPLLVDELR